MMFSKYRFDALWVYERGFIKMDVQLKTASFGGYDKKAVETYIDEMTQNHEKEVAELKANVLKLSETVKNLQTMREVNQNESSSTIDNLRQINDELEVEVTQLKEQLATYKQREDESASRYESISRTLLEARESADLLTRQTAKECDEKRAQTEAECAALTNETTANCEKMMSETTEACEKMSAETAANCEKLSATTKSSCQELKETTYANCEDMKRRAKDEAENLTLQTENACRKQNEETTAYCEELKAQTEAECDEMKNQARVEAYNIRVAVKKECESVSQYMAELSNAVKNVVSSVDSAKSVADRAFPEAID